MNFKKLSDISIEDIKLSKIPKEEKDIKFINCSLFKKPVFFKTEGLVYSASTNNYSQVEILLDFNEQDLKVIREIEEKIKESIDKEVKDLKFYTGIIEVDEEGSFFKLKLKVKENQLPYFVSLYDKNSVKIELEKYTEFFQLVKKGSRVKTGIKLSCVYINEKSATCGICYRLEQLKVLEDPPKEEFSFEEESDCSNSSDIERLLEDNLLMSDEEV